MTSWTKHSTLEKNLLENSKYQKEKELIRLSKKGDKSAFTELMRIYSDRIMRLSHKVCRQLPDEAENVFQEAFMQALKNIKNFHGKSGFGTWLYRITANQCWQKFREQKKCPASIETKEGIPKQEIPDPGPGPDRILEQTEIKRVIGKSLHMISGKFRDVLVRHHLEEKTSSKIAKELKISESAVKSRFHRARMLLRRALINNYKTF